MSEPVRQQWVQSVRAGYPSSPTSESILVVRLYLCGIMLHLTPAPPPAHHPAEQRLTFGFSHYTFMFSTFALSLMYPLHRFSSIIPSGTPHTPSSSQTSLSSALLSPLLQVHARRGDTVKHYPPHTTLRFPLWVRPLCAGSFYALLAAKPQMLPHPSAYMFLLPVFGVAFKDLRCSSSFPPEFHSIPFDLLNLWWKLKTALMFHFLCASSFHIFPCLCVRHFSLCAPCPRGKYQSFIAPF